MSNSTIHINFDNILQIANTGAKRAQIFLGFGVNAATDPNFKNYSLRNVTPIQLFENNLDDKTIEDVKKLFLTWITGCGLRELIESFGVFLDNIYDALLWVPIAKKELNEQERQALQKKFLHFGIEDKLRGLKERFGIELADSNYIISIHKARNCLTHRRGLVEKRDCNNDNCLRVNWIGLDLSIKDQSGNSKVIPIPIKEGVPFQQGDEITLMTVQREISFLEGSLIELPPKSLGEMCYYIFKKAEYITKIAKDYVDRYKPEVY